jgi:lincosamide nucleotidyltransferase A/C/D/E
VRWAIRNGHIPKVDFPYRTARTRPILGQQERLELLGALLDDEQRPLHLRVAAMLLLLYAQPLTRVVRLTADRVSLKDAGVWITFDHGDYKVHARRRFMAGSGQTPEMTADDVCRVVRLLDGRGIRVWLDGGWAVDACLGAQTRRHSDLDIVLEKRDVLLAVATLREHGYAPVPRDDTRAWNFVLGDDHGHQVDFHVIVLDEQGHGSYGPPENGERYPAAALTGMGAVNGRTVACITPEWLVRFHTGYDVDATDWADVAALCERFGIPVPDDYLPFQ